MACLQAHLEHALAAHEPELPAAIAALHARALGRRYATLACVRFDPVDRCVHWVVAGHPPPLLVQGKAIHPLHPTGPPVGLLERAAWSAGSRRLLAGDRIVLYTDGVAEGATEGLVRRLRATLAQGPAAIRDALLEAPAAVEVEDDRTVLVAEVEA
jgi:serine phosphatase RsbU (regulator of sigma subunit)